MIRYPSLNVSGLLAGVYVWWRSRVISPTPALIALAVRGRFWFPISFRLLFLIGTV